MNAETKSGIGLAVWGIAGVTMTVGVVSLGPVAWTLAGALLLAPAIAGVPVPIDVLFVGAALPLF